jgi:hypothetical protein
MCGACSRHGRDEKCTQNLILVGKPEGKRPLRRLRHSWEDNIKMDLREIGGRCGWNSSGLGQGPVVGSCEQVLNFQVP